MVVADDDTSIQSKRRSLFLFLGPSHLNHKQNELEIIIREVNSKNMDFRTINHIKLFFIITFF